jgi:hypothetical protein
MVTGLRAHIQIMFHQNGIHFVICSLMCELRPYRALVDCDRDRPEDGRHSLDLLATSMRSTFYVTHARAQPQSSLPVPTIETTFEVVGDGRIYGVRGDALERSIAQRRQSWQGWHGALFRNRNDDGDRLHPGAALSYQ